MNLRLSCLTRRVLATMAVLISGLVAYGPGVAHAAGTTYFVSRGGSDLRVCSANSVSAPFATIQRALSCAGDGDVISLASSGSKPYPGIGPVAANVTIKAANGATARTITIDAGHGPLTVTPGVNASLSGVTLTCLTNCSGAPTVTNQGTLLLTADTITNNTGIPAAAILDTTPDNSASSAALTIENSTIANNASKLGGAIQTNSGTNATGATTLNITNSTIADNVSLTQGGAIAALAPNPGSSTTITSTTITANTASIGGGLYASSPTTLANTIIAANKTHSGTATDCQSASQNTSITDAPGGHNLIGNPTGCGAINPGTNNDQTGVSRPGLLSLASNGGTTDTVALQTGSPAIATADPATCESGPTPDLDQRGHARTTAKRGCDVGAFDTGGKAATHAMFYVAPAGSDDVVCSANSVSAPFATIQRALSCAGDGDVISLASSGSKPYPGIGPVAANVTIKAANGATARTTTIDAGHGPLTVTPGANATLSGVTLNCLTSCSKAPTVTNQGTLLLSADTITGNTSIPTTAILDTTPDNSASSAALTIQNSTIANNDSNFGGAIQTNSGTSATGATTLNITNSTIADNVSLSPGGAIAANANTPGSSTTITSTTITANTANSGGGGLYALTPTTLANTIIAANKTHSGPTDCQSASLNTTITDAPGGHNLIGNPTGCGTINPGTNNDQTGSAASPLDPRLGPLAYNGGNTQTEPPLAGSPVIGNGSAADCLLQPVFGLDQRLQARNAAGRDVCDTGADDTGGATPAATPAAVGSSSATATVSSPLNVAIKASGSPTPVLAESGSLPAGVTFTDQGTGTALLSGTPAPGTAGTYRITITAENGNGSPAMRAFVLTVEPLAVTGVTPKTITAGASALTVTVAGTGFQQGAMLSTTNPGIAISTVVVKGPHSITAQVTAAADVSIGAYDLTVTEPGTSATCARCLTVIAPA